MSTLDELTAPLTPDEVSAAIYAAIAGRGGNPTAWKAGSPTRSIIAGVSIVISAISRLTAAIAKSGFLDRAGDDWLTAVALYVYNVERSTGTFAAGNVTIDNAGGGVYALDPGDLIVINSASGKGYRNISAVSIGALQTGVVVPVEAIELGSDSTSVAGAIDDFETALPGLSVTNATALVGEDPEDDEALRTRCREKTGTLSPNGPRDAYSFVAKSAKKSDGSTAGVTRVRTVPDGVGGVDVYVAGGTGTIDGTIGDTSTALGAVDDAIQRLVAPLAITATVQGATLVSITVTCTVWVRSSSGHTTSEIQQAIGLALAGFMAAQPIGGQLIPGESTGRLYKSAIEAAIDVALESLDPDDTFVIRRTVSLPASDVDLTISQAPVLGVPTVNVEQVAEGTL